MRKAKILLVADDPLLIEPLIMAAQEQEYRLVVTQNGRETLDIFRQDNIDLIILDLTMPRIDGWQVCRTIRAESNTPMIGLTGNQLEEEELIGFESGAIDYMNRSASTRVLMYRAVSLMNQARKQGGKKPAFIEVSSLKINADHQEVLLHNRRLNLSPREYELLYFLASNRGQLLSREQILDGVWGFDYFGDLRTVDTHVWRLREKLREAARMIKTVRGTGYQFDIIKEVQPLGKSVK